MAKDRKQVYRDSYLRNRQKRLEYAAKYREENKEDIDAKQKAERLANPEKWRLHSEVNRARYNYKDPVYAIWKRTKTRAEKLGIPFDIEVEDIVIPEFCPILGIKLVIGDKTRVFSPSIDKLIPSKGYVKGNITIISNRANMIKNNGTADEHFKIASWMTEKELEF